MKSSFYAIFALIVTSSFAIETLAAPAPKSDKTTINEARRNYARIENGLKNYTQTKADLPNDSVEGGELTVYSTNGVARKIVARLYGETGFAVNEFYFWNGQLFFALRTESRYDKPIWMAAEDNTQIGKVVRRTQNRFYFRRGKLIRWISNDGKFANLKSAQTAQQKRETLDAARKYLMKANKLLG